MIYIKFFKKAINLIFPSRCKVCGKVIYLGLEICDGCIAELSPIPQNIALMLISNPNINKRPGLTPVYDGIAGPYYYEDGSRKLILNLKLNGRRELAKSIGLDMYNTYLQYLKDKNISAICYVPSKFSDTFKRGYNHVKLLAKTVSKLTDIEVIPLLYVKNKKAPQHTLSGRERLDNIKDKYGTSVKYSVKGKNILLIDDVFTTGATFNECSRMLKLAGAKSVYGLMATINI